MKFHPVTLPNNDITVGDGGDNDNEGEDIATIIFTSQQQTQQLMDEIKLVIETHLNNTFREKLGINGNVNATKDWIEEEFRLEKKDVDVPMVLVKAIGSNAESHATDPLKEFLPAVTSVDAYLKPGSVQEWFIDLKGNNNKKMTLTMTIRSDSEYREAKQKGKLGAFMMLKLLYRGLKIFLGVIGFIYLTTQIVICCLYLCYFALFFSCYLL